MSLWTAAEAQAATQGRAIGDWSVEGISIDTRSLQPNDLFVALKAARDGHDFVAQALEKGAAAALVTHVPDGVAADAPLLVVADVQRALEDLGQAARLRTDARVVAVTGSVGKTSTKEMLAEMLAGQGKVHAAVASYNNHWGVPLTLARMPRDTDYAVIEIGMNHPGEIAPLAVQARPHVALITTVAAVHLEAFDSVADIAREKAAIFDGLEAGGVAVVNADLPETPILCAAANANANGAALRCFGRASTDYHLIASEAAGGGTEARLRIEGQELSCSIQSLGAHFAMNALGALAAVTALGADLAQAVAGLARWSPVTGRGARLSIAMAGGTLVVLDDSYNANPTSVGAALSVLEASAPPHATGGRRIAYLGDMKELGPEEDALHRALATHPAMAGIDVVHCVGPLMRHLYEALPQGKRGSWTEASQAAVADIAQHVAVGDIVLVKGSLSMQLARVVDTLRHMGEGSVSV